jgi:DNA-binding MltR family transcriptional regulator
MQGIIPVAKGQVQYEMKHLLHKLRFRDTKLFISLVGALHSTKEEDKITDEATCELIEEYIQNSKLAIHPLFELVDGGVESWEKVESFAGRNQLSASSLHTGNDEFKQNSSDKRKRKVPTKRSKEKRLKRKK